MKPNIDVADSVVNSRLRFVDILVKAGRLGDAIREITEIKQINPANPYIQAYEERLQSINPPLDGNDEYLPASSVQQTPSVQNPPVSPRIAHKLSTEEFVEGVTGQNKAMVQSPEKQQPKDIGLGDGIRVSADPHSKGRANIVLVDDDELLLEALVELLEDNKYRTKSFTKSEDALEYLKGHKPDLLLCDVNLETSSFGGFALFEKMIKLGHLHNIPFIFMSGLVDEAIIRAGKELGADDYLTKPFEPEMLLSVVKGKLRKYKLIEKNH